MSEGNRSPLRKTFEQSVLTPEEATPIARSIKALRDHTYTVEPGPKEESVQDYESIKPEVYALNAHILEQVHPAAEAALRADMANDSLRKNTNIFYPPQGDAAFSAEFIEDDFVFELFIANAQLIYPHYFNVALANNAK